MITIKQRKGLLSAALSGKCDFSAAREVLLRCEKITQETKIARVNILLEKVDSLNSCIIGAMLMLSDLVHGNLKVKVRNCSPEIQRLFESNFLTHYLDVISLSPLSTTCSRCFSANQKLDSAECLDCSST